MRPVRWLLPIGALLLCGAAPDPAQRCRGLLRTIPSAEASNAVGVGTTLCEFTGLQVLSSYSRMRVDRLIVAGLPADLPQGTVPARLHIEAHGVRPAPDVGSPLIAFIQRATIRPVDAVLDYALGPAGELRIEQLSVFSPVFGAVTMAAVLDRVPEHPETALAGTPFPRLRSLRLHVDGRGFFEAYAVPPLASALGGDDPEAALATAKAQVTQALGGVLVDGIVSDATLRALTDLVASVPRPSKPFDLWIELPKPIGLDELNDPARVRAALAPGSVSAAYGE